MNDNHLYQEWKANFEKTNSSRKQDVISHRARREIASDATFIFSQSDTPEIVKIRRQLVTAQTNLQVLQNTLTKQESDLQSLRREETQYQRRHQGRAAPGELSRRIVLLNQEIGVTRNSIRTQQTEVTKVENTLRTALSRQSDTQRRARLTAVTRGHLAPHASKR